MRFCSRRCLVRNGPIQAVTLKNPCSILEKLGRIQHIQPDKINWMYLPQQLSQVKEEAEEAVIFMVFSYDFPTFWGILEAFGRPVAAAPSKGGEFPAAWHQNRSSPQNRRLLKGHIMNSYDITTSYDKKIVLDHGLPKLNDANLKMLVGSCRTCTNQKIVGFPARAYSGRPFFDSDSRWKEVQTKAYISREPCNS